MIGKLRNDKLIKPTSKANPWGWSEKQWSMSKMFEMLLLSRRI